MSPALQFLSRREQGRRHAAGVVVALAVLLPRAWRAWPSPCSPSTSSQARLGQAHATRPFFNNDRGLIAPLAVVLSLRQAARQSASVTEGGAVRGAALAVAVGAPETGPPRSRRAPSRGMQGWRSGGIPRAGVPRLFGRALWSLPR